jgi:hypothetical protein
MNRSAIFLAGLLALVTASCAMPDSAAQTRPSDEQSSDAVGSPVDTLATWQESSKPLGGQQSLAGDVYTVIVPRDDLTPQTEMGGIPVVAGVSSKIYFFRCTCGHMRVVGEIAAVDYEANDVLDVLRGGGFTIASMAPMFLDTRPSMVSVRFQSEGDMGALVATLRKALDATGPLKPTSRPDK